VSDSRYRQQKLINLWLRIEIKFPSKARKHCYQRHREIACGWVRFGKYAGVNPRQEAHVWLLRWDHLRLRIADWRRWARERRELEGLSDATLHDIGITRGDVYREINKPF
jgi:uncharacterized protein YjiS (DUF1127 family)